jgi:hypothetical protein
MASQADGSGDFERVQKIQSSGNPISHEIFSKHFLSSKVIQIAFREMQYIIVFTR